jgi:thymidylate synthase
MQPFSPGKLTGGTYRNTKDVTSPDSGATMLEMPVLFHIMNPRDRLVFTKPIDVSNLVGLWNYLISGSTSANFISFYNPVGRKFVDEEVSTTKLRGNWGERLFATGAVDRCVALLRDSPNTRRAIIPVLQTDDVGYQSRNLPCLASIQFAMRNGSLDAFTTMRSQSAVGVLPYDLFLLTMLHEYIAGRAKIPLGEYFHFAPLFGVREREIRTMENIRSGFVRSVPMPPMPTLIPGHKALYLFCEAKTRTTGEIPHEADLLPAYWQGFLVVTRERFHSRASVKWNGIGSLLDKTFPREFLDNNSQL